MSNNFPIAANEQNRITSLSEFDLDYTNLQDNFKDLTQLAASIAGSEISLINLIDSFTQWSISREGIDLEQMPREDSVCQYTILQENEFEVQDLSLDDRFKNKTYVTDDPNLRYYYGIPLKTGGGINIGALCIMDKHLSGLNKPQTNQLKLIAKEVVARLEALRKISDLETSLKEAKESRKRLAHDVRGPLAGIVGLTELISEQKDVLSSEEIMEYVNLINQSSNSIISLANEILTSEINLGKTLPLADDELNQVLLKEKLIHLYQPQAISKKIQFKVNTDTDTQFLPFSKNKVLQIAGNLISNAIKFTPENGTIDVSLKIKIGTHSNQLVITVKDSGVGISAEGIEKLMQGGTQSTLGTSGELGYGYGLSMVKNFTEELGGSLKLSSTPGIQTSFEVHLPQIQH